MTERLELAHRQIKRAVLELKAQLQREREIKRDVLHRVLLEALHSDSMWDSA